MNQRIEVERVENGYIVRYPGGPNKEGFLFCGLPGLYNWLSRFFFHFGSDDYDMDEDPYSQEYRSKNSLPA